MERAIGAANDMLRLRKCCCRVFFCRGRTLSSTLVRLSCYCYFVLELRAWCAQRSSVIFSEELVRQIIRLCCCSQRPWVLQLSDPLYNVDIFVAPKNAHGRRVFPSAYHR